LFIYFVKHLKRIKSKLLKKRTSNEEKDYKKKKISNSGQPTTKDILVGLLFLFILFVSYHTFDKAYILNSHYFKIFDDWFKFFYTDDFYYYYGEIWSLEQYLSEKSLREFSKANLSFKNITEFSWESLDWFFKWLSHYILGIVLSFYSTILDWILSMETVLEIIKIIYEKLTKRK
jgi:hypothetical protein